jgi:hypothetical protein
MDESTCNVVPYFVFLTFFAEHVYNVPSLVYFWDLMQEREELCKALSERHDAKRRRLTYDDIFVTLKDRDTMDYQFGTRLENLLPKMSDHLREACKAGYVVKELIDLYKKLALDEVRNESAVAPGIKAIQLPL